MKAQAKTQDDFTCFGPFFPTSQGRVYRYSMIGRTRKNGEHSGGSSQWSYSSYSSYNCSPVCFYNRRKVKRNTPIGVQVCLEMPVYSYRYVTGRPVNRFTGLEIRNARALVSPTGIFLSYDWFPQSHWRLLTPCQAVKCMASAIEQWPRWKKIGTTLVRAVQFVRSVFG